MIFFLLPSLTTTLTLFSAALAIIGRCYGDGIGTMLSFTADVFGPCYIGGIELPLLVRRPTLPAPLRFEPEPAPSADFRRRT